MNRAFLNFVFKIVELFLRIGFLAIVFSALFATATGTKNVGDTGLALYHLASLSLIGVLCTWQSKRFAAGIVDIVRKPLFTA